jgi:hypothetical protein
MPVDGGPSDLGPPPDGGCRRRSGASAYFAIACPVDAAVPY